MTDGNACTIAELLAQSRAGNPRALGRLFEACRNYVGVVARSQVQSWFQAKVDPSDLVQQTLLDAYRSFHQFHGETEAEWLAWLRRVLDHNAADLVRHYRGTQKRQVAREYPLKKPGKGADSGSLLHPLDRLESPSQQLIRKERELRLADALADLPEDYREVIMLRNLQRLPFDEVARNMARSRPAVQMLWMRAIRKVRAAMREEQSESSAGHC